MVSILLRVRCVKEDTRVFIMIYQCVPTINDVNGDDEGEGYTKTCCIYDTKHVAEQQTSWTFIQ